MKLDSVITDILLIIGNKRQVRMDKVKRIMESYHKGIKSIIDEKEEPISIKMDFFGKIIYDDRAAKTIRKVKKEKREKRIKSTIKDELTLDELNSYRSKQQTSST